VSPAVDHVSVDIAAGEFVILVAPSGCGRSTILLMIAGLEDITSGDIYIGDAGSTTRRPRPQPGDVVPARSTRT
jgi:ABC-type sugar transport system ATPase subunit